MLSNFTYQRKEGDVLFKRLQEPRRFIQVIIGPRQSGKTVLVRQVMERLEMPVHYVSADDPTLRDSVWLTQQWEAGRQKTGPA